MGDAARSSGAVGVELPVELLQLALRGGQSPGCASSFSASLGIIGCGSVRRVRKLWRTERAGDNVGGV
jgi:hypothetical protein